MDKLLIPLSIILAGFIVAGSILVTGEKITFPQVLGFPLFSNNKVVPATPSQKQPPTAAPAPTPQSPPQPQSLNDGDLGTNPVLGSSLAKVVVTEFGDYQCPFCGQFASVVIPKLKNDYIDKGLVKFVYRDLAFLGPESKDASLASRCAAEQGKFWQYHDYIFNYMVNKEKQNPNQSQENVGNLSAVNLKSFAKSLGLNASKFNACFDGRIYDKAVQNDILAAQNYKVNSTPTVFVNGKYYDGNYGYDGLYSLIDSELKK